MDAAGQCKAHFIKTIASNRVPAASLLVGPAQQPIVQLINEIHALLLCTEPLAPCGFCRSCTLHEANSHPDITIVAPETRSASLKIEQIRNLQANIYQLPHHAHYRVITIYGAHRMNVASANSLLKILEEPPAKTVFLLCAEQISTLPATILSRCQRWFMQPTQATGLIEIAQGDPALTTLVTDKELWIEQLNRLLGQKQSLTQTAQYFSSHDLAAVLTFLYAFTLELLRHPYEPDPALKNFHYSLSHYHLLHMVNEINAIRKKVNHTISINPLLAIERLLFFYCLAFQDEQELL